MSRSYSNSHLRHVDFDSGLFVKATRCVVLAVFVSYFISWATWIYTSWQSSRALAEAARAGPKQSKRPPTLPSSLPFLGHVFQFLMNGHEFLMKASKHFGNKIPFRMNLAGQSMYLVTGREAVSSFLSDKNRELSIGPNSRRMLEYALGCPPELLEEFERQDEVSDRQMHDSWHALLSGRDLDVLVERYQLGVAKATLAAADKIGYEWTEIEDLNTFVGDKVMDGASEAVFGPHMVRLNPTIGEDMTEFNKHVGSLFNGMPWWINYRAHKARNKMRENVKRWQQYARSNCNINDIPDDVEWEEYYGSRFVRLRNKAFPSRGVTSEEAILSENFAFVWVTHVNAVPSACWFILETCHDQSLFKRVLPILDAGRIESPDKTQSPLAFNSKKLSSDTLLQSIFAEVLRQRVAPHVVRTPKPETGGYTLPGNWHIKPGEMISLSILTEHMDPDIWNTGDKANPHPLEEFWADRFIVYPDDPKSGPLKEPKHKKNLASKEPYFSLDGTTWSWVPFAGGRSLCPGRHFAKYEIILTAAIFLSVFDIELLMDKVPESDHVLFGIGTLPPAGKVRCRIRKRKQPAHLKF